MDITEFSIVHHIGIVIGLLWIFSSFGFCNLVVYLISFIYLCLVNERYTQKLRKRLQFEERKQANQRRLLSDSETVRWLNHAVEKVWPICMEQIASQKVLFPIIPWFLDKYKPWTARKAVVQHLYLGRNPPIFTEIRVRGQSTDDDHLVMELGMNFLSADDMSAILAVKLRKRLGGIWAKMHVTRMHVEGKVLVGVKFLRHWPFLGRLRVCFVEPPYFQMTVKPIFNHGFDVTELPGISGWLENLLAIAFEQTLVEPNMLVVDMQKFASAPTEGWFTMDEKTENCAIAFAMVEIVEATDLKPSDLNGLADPYVNGQLGRYGFQTKTQKRTLAPKWQEEFKIPICTWESPSVLLLEVHDKDHFRDDNLGCCSVNIGDLRGRQRRDMWLPLQNVNTGRLHLAVTVCEVDKEEEVHLSNEELSNKKENTNSMASESSQQDSDPTVSSEKVPKLVDQFEPIDIEGQEQTGIWVHHPGDHVFQTWEPRKGRTRPPKIQIHKENNDFINISGSVASGNHHNDSSSDSEDSEGNRVRPPGTIRRGIRKIGSIFNRGSKDETPHNTGEIAPTPSPNVGSVDEKDSHVKFLEVGDNTGVKGHRANKESISPGSCEPESPSKGNMKGMAKSILKQAGRSAHSVKHAFSMKGTKKSKGDPKTDAGPDDFEPVALLVSGIDIVSTEKTDKENSQGPYLSDELMGYSPKIEGKSIDSASPSGLEMESPHAQENIQVGPFGFGRDINKPLVRNVSLKGMECSDEDVADQADAHSQMCSFDTQRDTRKRLERKVSFQCADMTDDDMAAAPRDMQGQVVPSDSPRATGEQLIRKASFQGSERSGDDMTAPMGVHCQVNPSDSTIGITEPLLRNISLEGVDRSDDNLAASKDMQGRVAAPNSARDTGDPPIRIASLPPTDKSDDDVAGHAGVHDHVGPSDSAGDIGESQEVTISR